jgi:hypothetical protein
VRLPRRKRREANDGESNLKTWRRRKEERSARLTWDGFLLRKIGTCPLFLEKIKNGVFSDYNRICTG